MPAGEGGYILNVHGRQYMQLHSMFRGIGVKALAGVLSYDNALEGREEEIFAEYVSQAMSPLMKQARSAQLKMGLGFLPVLFKLLWDFKGTVQRTDDAVEEFTAAHADRELNPRTRARDRVFHLPVAVAPGAAIADDNEIVTFAPDLRRECGPRRPRPGAAAGDDGRVCHDVHPHTQCNRSDRGGIPCV